MPSKNSTKRYLENSYYHLYNRGVEKRKIFMDKQDYSVFLSYLKEYLLPKDEKMLRKKLSDDSTASIEKQNILRSLRLNNFNSELSLLAFCLMPNHFHFFVKQRSSDSIDKFMNSLCTRYSMYFNKKHNRVGSLYQDVYKAVLVENDYQLLHLSRYIHKQALALKGDALQSLDGQPSSFMDYTGRRKTEWVKPGEVLSYFSKSNPSLSYKNFVMANDDDDLDISPELMLDDD